MKLLEQVRRAVRVRHFSVRTAMLYTHVLNRSGMGVMSPLDRINQELGRNPPATPSPKTGIPRKVWPEE